MGLFLNDIKSHFKLDLFDKIIICLVFVIGALFSPFYCFADEIESVSFSNVPYTSFNSDRTEIIENTSSGTGIAYFQIEPGYKYYLTNNSTSSNKLMAFSSDIPSPGVFINYIGTLPSNGGTYEFNGSSYGYLYFDYYSSSSQVSCTREPLRGMEDTIDILSYDLSIESIWNTFVFAIPYISVVVLVCIGLLIIRRLLFSLSKGKSRI